jgi:hypothetical protein
MRYAFDARMLGRVLDKVSADRRWRLGFDKGKIVCEKRRHMVTHSHMAEVTRIPPTAGMFHPSLVFVSSAW